MGRTLEDMKAGESGEVVRISSGGALRRRMLDMGVTRGATVEVNRHAPLGDPIEICVKGYYLALRREEARHIHIAAEG